MLGYPPVAHMLAVQIFGKDEEEAFMLAKKLARIAGEYVDNRESVANRMMILGPAPASIGRINDIFRFVFYIKYGKYGKLVQIKDCLEEQLKSWDIGKESVQFDFDPMNTL